MFRTLIVEFWVSGEDLVSKSSVQVQEASEGESDGRAERPEPGEPKNPLHCKDVIAKKKRKKKKEIDINRTCNRLRCVLCLEIYYVRAHVRNVRHQPETSVSERR